MEKSLTRVISFTSGKGGVGKSNLVLNCAIALAKLGKSVLVLDADLGLANVDVLLGLRPQYTIYDVIQGRRQLREVILSGPEGISIIPAASGIEAICTLEAEDRYILMQAIEEVAYQYDYLLIDTQAGIGPDVMYFNTAASEIICVINGEPTSLTDSYALIKVLSRNYAERTISIVVNNISLMSTGEGRTLENEAKRAFARLSRVVDKFLQVDLKYLGFIPADLAVKEAVSMQKAFIETYPSSKASLALTTLAKRIDADFIERRVKGGMQFFFKQILEIGAHGG